MFIIFDCIFGISTFLLSAKAFTCAGEAGARLHRQPAG